MLLRTAVPGDAMAVARVHVRSWQAAYRGLLPDETLDQLRPEDRAAKYDFASHDTAKPHTVVALEDGVIHAFATTMPSRDADTLDHGELCALYVDPEQWGRGIGVTLLSAAHARLASLGFRDAALWVFRGNVRAERFYRRYGWVCDGKQRTEIVWGVSADEIRYRRSIAPPD